MLRRMLVVWILCGVAPSRADDPKPSDSLPRRVLPGASAGGFVQLPNQWKLAPTGTQIEVGDLPVNVQLHPSGQYAAVLHCGYKNHEIVVLNLNTRDRRIVSRTVVQQAFYGLAFSPDGRQIYASGGEFDVVHAWDFDKGVLHNARTLDVSAGRRTVPSGLILDATGRELFVASLWAHCVVRVPLDNPANKVIIPITAPKEQTVAPQPAGLPPSPPDGRKEPAKKRARPLVEDEFGGVRPVEGNGYPYTVLPSADGKKLFVSLWSQAAVAVIDLESNTCETTWATASHPTEMALTADGKVLYVACANSTAVSVLDTETGAELQTIHCALYPRAPSGNTPNSLTLTPDGQVLVVANADANNLAVFNVADPKAAKPLGFIPTGWYPTSVRFNKIDKTLYVSNGKGGSSRANRLGPIPTEPGRRATAEYIGSLFGGTLSVIPMPDPAAMAKHSKTAYQCSPLAAESAVNLGEVEEGNPIPRRVGDKSPIKYVIYVVKENRTYDQVFGDIAKGNGEPELCLFPRRITPNHHRLAEEFVLLDNTYVDGEVSADGHEWSMGAYATDFVEKLWPQSYRGSPTRTFGYPAEGTVDAAARPAGGYIWDRAKEAGISYRSYGEWVKNGTVKPDGTFNPGVAAVPALEGHIDPEFRSYDLNYTDVKRAERFVSEVNRFAADGQDMPQLQIVRLPNDHTAGTRVGMPTPTAMVADNDLALGILVEGVSKSKFWPETAIFVIEDDAQNGPDHVDAHRVVALVISPYAKRKHVDSTLYSTTSLLRTMELILGLKPMSQFDAAARPMYQSFQAKPDLTPYTHSPAEVDVNELNVAGAWGADRSAAFNLAVEDAADDLLFNEVIWKSVRGPNSRMPAPVRAAFFLPIKAAKPDDD